MTRAIHWIRRDPIGHVYAAVTVAVWVFMWALFASNTHA